MEPLKKTASSELVEELRRFFRSHERNEFLIKKLKNRVEAAVARFPGDPSSWLARLIISVVLRDRDMATNAARALDQLEPDRLAALQNSGLAFFNLGMMKEAWEHLHKLKDEYPQNPGACQMISTAGVQSGHFLEASEAVLRYKLATGESLENERAVLMAATHAKKHALSDEESAQVFEPMVAAISRYDDDPLHAKVSLVLIETDSKDTSLMLRFSPRIREENDLFAISEAYQELLAEREVSLPAFMHLTADLDGDAIKNACDAA